MIFRALPLLAASTLAFAAPALSQEPPLGYNPNDPASVEAYLRARGEAYHRAPDIEQNPEEVRRTQALNAEIAAQNELAASEEAANQAAYEAEQARYADSMAAAEAERLNYEADMDAWRAQASACERGNRAACGPVRDPRY
jgi:hypothetical protein